MAPETRPLSETRSPSETRSSPETRSYHLQAILGKGGFGSVYRGVVSGSSGFSKPVAIKVLRHEEAKDDPAQLGMRLRDEARLLSLLRHRAIVNVDDLVQIDGRWAVVMEYIDGADLKDLVELGPIPARPVCEIAAEVAGALAIAHAALDPATRLPLGIVHRDIKPANIRITPNGEIKVLDFGVARAQFSDREAETRSLTFGSLGYMAPERMDGRDTQTADIYALGAVICESLTGQAPGQLSVDPQKHAAQLDALLDGAIEGLDGDAAVPLRALLRAMLAYRPEERPRATEVADALQDLQVIAPGPWLKRWAPVALASVRREEAPIPGDKPRVTGARRVLQAAPTGRSSATLLVRAAPFALAMGGVAFTLVLGLSLAAWLFLREGTSTPAPAPPVGAESTAPAHSSSAAGAEPAGPSGDSPAPTDPAAPDRPTPHSSVQDPGEAAVAAPTASRAPAASKASAPPSKTTAPMGTFSVGGDATEVLLRGADGVTHPPGSLPAGRYDLLARFPSGRTIDRADLIVITADEELVVRCDASVENCR